MAHIELCAAVAAHPGASEFMAHYALAGFSPEDCRRLYATDAAFRNRVDLAFQGATYFLSLAVELQVATAVAPSELTRLVEQQALRGIGSRIKSPQKITWRARLGAAWNRLRRKPLTPPPPRPNPDPALAAALFLDPAFAAALGRLFDPPFAVPFSAVYAAELQHVLASRERRSGRKAATNQRDNPFLRAHKEDLAGLALSGGGIRSATFNLGFLQALADFGLLKRIDYLSTVSGGGYIGSWLQAWTYRRGGIAEVEAQMAATGRRDPDANAARPLAWLRSYSSYLAPKRGFWTGDAWSIASIWFRNALLNQCVLLMAAAALALAPRLAANLYSGPDSTYSAWLLLSALLLLALAGQTLARGIGAVSRISSAPTSGGLNRRTVAGLIIAPMCAGTLLLGVAWWSWLPPAKVLTGASDMAVRVVALLTLLMYFSMLNDAQGIIHQLRGKLGPELKRTLKKEAGLYVAGLTASVVPAIVAGLWMWLWLSIFVSCGGLRQGAWKWHVLVWATPVLLSGFGLASIVHVGIMGRAYRDEVREWWGRQGALLGMTITAWIAWTGAAVYGPYLLRLAAVTGWERWSAAGYSLAWISACLAGAVAANDKRSAGAEPGWRAVAAKAAAVVFAAGLALLVSLAVDSAIAARSTASLAWPPEQLGTLESLIAVAALALGAIALGWRVDINQFSMNPFYRNRLVRCYLGASRTEERAGQSEWDRRQPDPFTGMDWRDDIRLDRLKVALFSSKWDHTGPFAIIGAALNLVGGAPLAWQQRKAQSFMLTPLYSGFSATAADERTGVENLGGATRYGYRLTEEHAARQGGMTLGQATAISGAAVSPNMGYHSSPAVTFLLGVFNVRLGWWVGNPRYPRAWALSGPRLSLVQLFRELLGRTDSRQKFVYLSDGGHFENLGIYELVKRRLPLIIACDASADEDFNLEGLGNAIRKCRMDLGAEIDLRVGALKPDMNSRTSLSHYAAGRVLYADGATATIVYIKATLTGREGTDLVEYKAAHPDFPHHTTTDQFFDENAFESYRQLGYEIGLGLLNDAAERAGTPARSDLGLLLRALL